MPAKVPFEGYVIVSCGTLRQELEYLRNTGFLNAEKILYTAPGLHEVPMELERQLKKQIESVRGFSGKILVVYGGRCYIDSKDPGRSLDKVIKETGVNAKRIKAKNCIDMLVDIDEREKIRENKKVYWLSCGWLQYWKAIFKDWDNGKANETFPQQDKAILLDGLGMFEKYSADCPEELLEFSDWMHLSIEPHRISLDRLKRLLVDEITQHNEA